MTVEISYGKASVPLYRACGFEPIEVLEPAASDGVRIPCVSMEKSIGPGAHAIRLREARCSAATNLNRRE